MFEKTENKRKRGREWLILKTKCLYALEMDSNHILFPQRTPMNGPLVQVTPQKALFSPRLIINNRKITFFRQEIGRDQTNMLIEDFRPTFRPRRMIVTEADMTSPEQ